MDVKNIRNKIFCSGHNAQGFYDGLGTGVQPGAGTSRVLSSAGVPGQGTNAVQTLTIGGTPTGGTFTLTFESQTTAAITWSAVNATLLAAINAALDLLSNLGVAGAVATAGTLTAGIGTVTITFGAARERQVVGVLSATSSLTGTAPTLAVANTTPGVDAAFRGWPAGQVVRDTTNKKLYVNTGTSTLPVWTVAGAQT